MNKRTFSFGFIIIFTVILFYFLSTKTSLQLFVKTTKADGQSTSYGVDVIKFNRPIGLQSMPVGSVMPTNNTFKIQFSANPTTPVQDQESLYATKDGNSWTDLMRKGASPIASVVMYAGNVSDAVILSDGAYPCNGTSPGSSSDYDELFNRIGTTYGGSGRSNFRVPNWNNEGVFLRGTGGNSFSIGNKQNDGIKKDPLQTTRSKIYAQAQVYNPTALATGGANYAMNGYGGN